MNTDKTAVTGEGNALRTVRLLWRTPSGSGSMELTYACKDYSEAFKLAREHFHVAFTGYTLIGTSIA